MPWWGGRGHRWMFKLTGLPGWIRFDYWYPQTTSKQLWLWRCRWFPWMPRWWWTGMYGPIEWTKNGPRLVTQQNQPQGVPSSREEEIELLLSLIHI